MALCYSDVGEMIVSCRAVNISGYASDVAPGKAKGSCRAGSKVNSI